MTKKDLLENDLFKSLPDDTEIVFGTNKDLRRCVPMNALNISVMQQCINNDSWKDIPLNVRDNYTFTPQYKTALVIDAAPYWYLQEAYHITFTEHDNG